MDWRIFAVVAPFLFVCYQSLSKLLPKNLSTFLVNAYVSVFAALVMFIIYFATSSTKSVSLPTKYLPLIAGIGILIGLGNYAIIKAYALGAPQSGFTSLFNPLYIVYGVLFGLIIWHEKLNVPQMFGIFLSVVGIVIVAYFKK